MRQKISKDTYDKVIDQARYLEHFYQQYLDQGLDLGLTEIDEAKIEELINADTFRKIRDHAKKSLLANTILLSDEDYRAFMHLKKYLEVFGGFY